MNAITLCVTLSELSRLLTYFCWNCNLRYTGRLHILVSLPKPQPFWNNYLGLSVGYQSLSFCEWVNILTWPPSPANLSPLGHSTGWNQDGLLPPPQFFNNLHTQGHAVHPRIQQCLTGCSWCSESQKTLAAVKLVFYKMVYCKYMPPCHNQWHTTSLWMMLIVLTLP